MNKILELVCMFSVLVAVGRCEPHPLIQLKETVKGSGNIDITWKYPKNEKRPAFVNVFILEIQGKEHSLVEHYGTHDVDTEKFRWAPKELGLTGSYYAVVTSAGVPNLKPGKWSKDGVASEGFVLKNGSMVENKGKEKKLYGDDETETESETKTESKTMTESKTKTESKTETDGETGTYGETSMGVATRLCVFAMVLSVGMFI
ncbi:MAG: uncharacterized protein A8A55_0692 [Amphiamblys sp. WSBS2006]|nr:MAG: uncharacterized protein A8A55_0692 [Amphiamblys sp. WSBS2006]